MRKHILYISLIFPLMAVAQPSLNEIRRDYSTIFYDLKGTSPSISILDEYINTYFALGDKFLINSMILDNLMGNQGEMFKSRLDDYQLNKADSAVLAEAPALSSDLRERPYHTFIYLVYARARRDSLDIIRSLFSVIKDKADRYPNLPTADMRSKNALVNELILTADFLYWGIAYPAELAALSTEFRNAVPEAYRNRLGDFLALLHEDVAQTFYSYYIPKGIARCQEGLRIAANQLHDDAFMRENPDVFIRDTFESLLGRPPSPAEAEALSNYINDNSDLTATTIFYTLILKRQMDNE